MNKEPSASKNIRAFCAFCGKPIIPNAEFCSYCGKSQLTNVMGQNTGFSVSNEAPKEIIKPSKPNRKNTILLIVEIGFAVLALLTASLLNLIKYKTNEAEIIFWNGAERSVISHDIAMYKIWMGGLIVTAILFFASIICLVIRFICLKHLGIVEVTATLAVFFFFLILNIPHWSKYDDMKSDYDVVKLLDDKKTNDDFVPYFSEKTKKKKDSKKPDNDTPTPIPTPTPKPVLKRADFYFNDEDHPIYSQEYDEQGRVILREYKSSNTTYTFEYEGDKLKSWNKKEYALEGEVTTTHNYYYNEKGQLIRETEDNPFDDYKRILKEFIYDEKDRLIEIEWTIENYYNVGDNVYVTTFGYDDYGQLVTERTRKRRGENKKYVLFIAEDYPASEVLTVNREVDYSYEKGNLIKKITKIQYGEEKQSIWTEYEYYNTGKVWKITEESWQESSPSSFKYHSLTENCFDYSGLLQFERHYTDDLDAYPYEYGPINYDVYGRFNCKYYYE